MLNIHAIPAFTDNYIWLLQQDQRAVVVDPGDARPVIAQLSALKLQLQAVLITHWHPDHAGGAAQLHARYQVPVYGPRAEAAKITSLTHLLGNGDTVPVLDQEFKTISIAGHTLGHIALYTKEVLLCGDTLFSAGCGRLFEGTPAQMYDSLSRLAALPGATQVFCGHEYTLANLAFAQAVEPLNPAITQRIAEVRALRASGQPSLPSTIARECSFNPFLRCTQTAVIEAAQKRSKLSLLKPVQVFSVLREWKDKFAAVAP